MENEIKYTPMIQQYLEIKKDYKDAIVFFRLGDFYEMFFEDAAIASRILEITLTGKDAGARERVPMCGIPFHAYQGYAEKLIEAGYKVAICEQVEDPREAKGIVKRDVIKILTPGTIIDDFLDSKKSNYLSSIYQVRNNFIFAYADISTGDSFITLLNSFDECLEQIRIINTKEVVITSDFDRNYIKSVKDLGVIVSYEDNIIIPNDLSKIALDINQAYYPAIGILLNYAIYSLKQGLKHLKPFKYYTDSEYMKLDYFTKRNLELTETLRLGQKSGSVLSFLDKTETAMGARLLRKWIDKPLMNTNDINKRLDVVNAMYLDTLNRDNLRINLRGVYDIERIIAKISCDSANAKDLVQLYKTLSNVPSIKDTLLAFNDPNTSVLADKLDLHSDLCNLLNTALLDNPPFTIKEGQMIKEGFNSELDELRNLSNNSKDYLLKYEASERERLGVKNLKVGYNRVFGYYIEISKGQSFALGDVEGYVRKQTLANSERYISPELKKLEDTLLGAKERIEALEYELFIKIREYTKSYIVSLQLLASLLSEVDCYLSLSTIADKYNYVRPKFNKVFTEINDGRHPVLEDILKEKYVPNDVMLNDKNILLITGPNMSGKSTYMRMIAVIVIMAQIGSFVPASSANIQLCDQIFTRIGASDDLYSGQSTFMVEMSEANYALRNATSESLILFDEIGRGTATYDGMALAEAILEYIHAKIKCRTLFSTHYHELTKLEESLNKLLNVHVAAIESKGSLSFLHKVSLGPADKSYGINVAELAGLPKPLINRSKVILYNLESNNKTDITAGFFDFEFEDEKEEFKPSPVVELLAETDVDDLSPKEALNLLYRLKEMI